MTKKHILELALSQGFDESKVSCYGVSVRCSQCEAMVINGVGCHEHGCPNKPGEEHDYE